MNENTNNCSHLEIRGDIHIAECLKGKCMYWNSENNKCSLIIIFNSLAIIDNIADKV